VELLTIGAFARAAELTPKALRLYDQLGLLPPAAIDPGSGYRLYDAAQLRQARLIAQLRRLGMPLAAIRTVCAMPPGEAATAVTAYWRQVTAETAERARLATFLADDLSGKDTSMTTLQVRFAAAAEIGSVRQSNQDVAYASDQLFAVADGGGAGGHDAASAAVEAVKAARDAGSLLAALQSADRTIRGSARDDEQPISTLTAMARADNRLTLVHIGDTRAYLLRDGELTTLTQDHTWVRRQVDAGKLTPAEAAAHPQRALLTRALGGGGDDVEADLSVRTAAAGDRYLLCSDGLHAVIDHAALRDTLVDAATAEEAVRRLVEAVEGAGAPDNVACVVADFTA
jgi:serine/threonine protein phosphatase PrpC